ncbi:hypothetical protein [Bradyrhizobium liaoningense]
MAILFWIVVILLLFLTGAIVPVLYFGFWALAVVLILVLAVWAFLRVCGFVLQPFAMIASDVAGWVRSRERIKRPDPDHKYYVEWANRTGEFAAYSDWEAVKSILDQRRKADDEREAWLRRINK